MSKSDPTIFITPHYVFVFTVKNLKHFQRNVTLAGRSALALATTVTMTQSRADLLLLKNDFPPEWTNVYERRKEFKRGVWMWEPAQVQRQQCKIKQK